MQHKKAVSHTVALEFLILPSCRYLYLDATTRSILPGGEHV
jgi:hypothetical protein